MTPAYGYLRRASSLWLSAWPIWMLVLFSTLAAVHALPGGYARAVVALPILLLVPGSLTVGAVFGARNHPQGTLLVGYTTVLSLLLLAFASLALYVAHISITASSTYFILLGLCVVLAIVAQLRLLMERPPVGRRAADSLKSPDRYTRSPDDNSDRTARTMRIAPVAAIVTGISLLLGSVYFYDHHPSPPAAGYTQLAWASTPENSSIAVGQEGTRLNFEIVHREPRQDWFRLSAAWQGSSMREIAKPLTLSIGPNKTFRGNLFVPAPSGRCTYRLVITLTEIKQVDPLTKHQPTWSINANVHKSGKSRSTCAQ
ncbi:MAG: DUF1616 domain-containing protein [Pseudonocardiaceae bacterium]